MTVAHSLLVSIYHLRRDHHLEPRDRERLQCQSVRRLAQLGSAATLTSASASVA